MEFQALRIFCFIFIAFAGVSPAFAQAVDFYGMDRSRIIVCADSGDQIPDFSGPDCSAGADTDVDPQGTHIWFKAYITLPRAQGINGQPFSLYISGKMASEAYLNGQYVGRNGIPAADPADETVGLMDTELFPPQSLFRLGENEVVVRASAHNGFILLARPLHSIAIAPAGIGAMVQLPYYIPALIMLGLFIISAFYFTTMALIGSNRERFTVLACISFFAAGQLVSEAMRGLVQYTYPVHDLRLISIAVFSALFGLAALMHVLRIYAKAIAFKIIAAVTALDIIILVFTPSFDFKALLAMSVPLFVALVASGVWAYQRRRRAFVYFLIMLVFLAAVFVFQGLFLDTYFYLLVAFFLLLIFVEQALTLAEEARVRRREEARADKLALALAEAEERDSNSEINVKSAGKIERLQTRHIIHCKGAGGYTEIMSEDGRILLHTATLNELEEELPATFLRVHRSHLINVTFVQTLNRDPSGTGMLVLSGDIQVPVSRRVMPKVRKALV